MRMTSVIHGARAFLKMRGSMAGSYAVSWDVASRWLLEVLESEPVPL